MRLEIHTVKILSNTKKAPLALQAAPPQNYMFMLIHHKYWTTQVKNLCTRCSPRERNLQIDPWLTMSAICPKVMQGHQHVRQPMKNLFHYETKNILMMRFILFEKKRVITVWNIGGAVIESSGPRDLHGCRRVSLGRILLVCWGNGNPSDRSLLPNVKR